MNITARSTIGISGDGSIVTLLVGIVRSSVLLLLERDGEAKVAILLAEVGVVEAGDGGRSVARCYAGAAAVVHVDIVRVGGFGFFTHGVVGVVAVDYVAVADVVM